MGLAAILNFGSKPFYLVSEMRSRLKVWTDDGRTTEVSHPLSSSGAFGSGELKHIRFIYEYQRTDLRRIFYIPGSI